MRLWLRRIGFVLAALVVLVILVPWTAGAFMPREHRIRGERVVRAPLAEVWTSVSGFDEVGQWVPDLANMTRVTDVEGLPSYELRNDEAIVSFTFREVSAPSRLVVELGDAAETFGGEWTYELEATSDGTRVVITEEGWVEPAYFRFMMWVFGYERTIEAYLAALARKHERRAPAP